jgi:riboflavin kinase/FMN adenylyltransferase
VKIIRNIKFLNRNLKQNFKEIALPPLALAIGNFDGLHVGHLEIINKVKEIALQKKISSALVTFEPHPSNILNPNHSRDFRITNLASKLKIIKDQQIDYVIILPFNYNLAGCSADDFVVKILLDALNLKHLVIGHDFIFGKNRQGDINFLQDRSIKYGFDLTKIDAFKIFIDNNYQNYNSDNAQICSSSKVRAMIVDGKIEIANKILGRNFTISGFVVGGNKIASKIGFPTANILSKPDIIKPKFGVYQILVEIVDLKQKFVAILNYGVRPTVNLEQKLPIYEIHIFNYDEQKYGSLYGRKLQIEFISFIREERKFASLEELKEQIKKDCQRVLKVVN